MPSLTPEQIDALLPQTQCGLCGYDGCMPYAEAMAYENTPINLCPPGGVKTLLALGALLQQDPAPYIADMEKSAKPKMIAVIREAECIGCTICIQACPVDSILGSAKHMHSVITAECTGCELCVEPCPVDCIDLVTLTSEESVQNEADKANLARQRHQNRSMRLAKENEWNRMRKIEKSKIKKISYIEEAIERTKAKKRALSAK